MKLATYVFGGNRLTKKLIRGRLFLLLILNYSSSSDFSYKKSSTIFRFTLYISINVY